MKSITQYIVWFALFSFHAHSTEHFKQEKGYEVNYIALSTMVLTPMVAKNYHIGRSKSKGFVNIAVLKQNDGAVSTPVKATILLSAKNLYGQNKPITLKEISENNGAIYYIGTFSVSSQETINFKAQIQPKDSNQAIDIKFNQEFYTD